jgi:internalin A
MKRFTLILSVLISLGAATAVSTASVDQEYKVGNDPNLKVLSKFAMPKEFSFGDLMEMDENSNLWVSGLESIKNDQGKRELKRKIAVFNTTNSDQPKLLVIHDLPPASGGQFGFYNQYLYLAYNATWRMTPEKNRKTIPHLRFGFMVYDVHDPLNPVLVGKTGGLFKDFPIFKIDKTAKSMYVANSSTSGLVGPGYYDQTTIYKLTLEDPGNPKIVSSKIVGPSGGEIKAIDGNVVDGEIRDKFLFAMTQDKIYVFDTSKNPLQLICREQAGLSNLWAICLAEEYMDRDEIYAFASGSSMQFNYPTEDPNPGNSLFQNGIILLSMDTRDSFPFGSYMGFTSTEVRLPFTPYFIHSKGTLVYAGGGDMYFDRRSSAPPASQFMVVDFSILGNPQFSGLLEFDGSITGMIVKENRAYLLLSSGKAQDMRQTLVTLEIPQKEGIFQRQYLTMGEMYPGYKEPEIIPNPIEDDLREFTDKSDGQLTSADFKDIKALDFKSKKLTDIAGLELCADLEELNLYGNYLTDISQLSNLRKLRVLDLSFDKVENLEPLSNLPSLEELNLYGNKVTDITPLLKLSKLKKLNLSNNNIIDFTPVSQMTSLTDLKLGYGKMFKPPSFSNLKDLKVLNLAYNDIFNADFIADLSPSLEDLELWGNNIKSINGISRLTNLKKLGLHDNNLSDINFLKDITWLEELNISSNKKLVDLTPLAGLTGLKKLNISELYIDDLSCLKGLVNLEDLNISHINTTPKKISDLRPIANLNKLQMFRAGENEIESIKPLAGLTELVTLDLRRNKIRNIDALSNLSKLEKLNLSENKITDISPISNLEKLNEITVFKNEIKDFESFVNGKISSDCTITIGGNPAPGPQIDILRKKLVVLPNENEGSALSNFISVASCEINFHADKGRYTDDIKEFVSGGYLLNRGSIEELTLDRIISKYDVALFDIQDKTFTIIIVPEKDVNGRTFGITQEGIVLEWIGDGTPDLTITDLSGDNWKRWPAECRFSVYSCGSGG